MKSPFLLPVKGYSILFPIVATVAGALFTAGNLLGLGLFADGRMFRVEPWTPAYLMALACTALLGGLLYLNARALASVEERLEEAEDGRGLETEANEALLHNPEAGVVIYAAGTRPVYANRRASELTGLSHGQLMRKMRAPRGWSLVKEDGSVLRPREHPEKAIFARREVPRNTVLGVSRPGNGERTWLNVYAFPREGEKGEVEEVVVTFTDITGWKRAEESVRSALDTVREARKMDAIGRRAGELARDYDGVFGVIDGNIRAMMEELGNASPLQSRARAIGRAAGEGAALTAQLVALGAGKKPRPGSKEPSAVTGTVPPERPTKVRN